MASKLFVSGSPKQRWKSPIASPISLRTGVFPNGGVSKYPYCCKYCLKSVNALGVSCASWGFFFFFFSCLGCFSRGIPGTLGGFCRQSGHGGGSPSCCPQTTSTSVKINNNNNVVHKIAAPKNGMGRNDPSLPIEADLLATVCRRSLSLKLFLVWGLGDLQVLSAHCCCARWRLQRCVQQVLVKSVHKVRHQDAHHKSRDKAHEPQADRHFLQSLLHNACFCTQNHAS